MRVIIGVTAYISCSLHVKRERLVTFVKQMSEGLMSEQRNFLGEKFVQYNADLIKILRSHSRTKKKKKVEKNGTTKF